MTLPTSALHELSNIKQTFGFNAALGEQMIFSFEDTSFVYAHLINSNVITEKNMNETAIIPEALGSKCLERIKDLDIEVKMKQFEDDCINKGIKYVRGWLENPGAIDLYKNNLGYMVIRIGDLKAPSFLIIKELGRPIPETN